MSDVANTILEQLGGNRFRVMTGARHFMAAPKALSFQLPTRLARQGITHVQVSLQDDDTYNVAFMKVRGTTFRLITSSQGVHADDLREYFRTVTGLDTSL